MNKNKKNKFKLLLIILLLLLVTGCTTTLTDSNKKPVKNSLGQSLTKNIICQPTDKATIKIYKKNGVDISKLPKCADFKITNGKYEGLWTSIFVKPLAFLLIWLSKFVGNYGLALVIVSLLIRLIAYPVTKKTAMQSEFMKKAQPEINRIQNKYKDKKDNDSMMKQSQEMMIIYKKYKISPMSGCIFSLIQLPIFLAFFEAVQRTPAIFEDTFLGLQLGTTPSVGFGTSIWFLYLILILIITATTYFSFNMSMNATSNNDMNMKMMPYMMTGMIAFTAMFMPSALGIYWVTSNIFTIIQNFIVKRSKEVNGKA